MKTVYLIRSIPNQHQRYVGLTSNLGDRLKEHYTGKSPHTSKHRPWRLAVAVLSEDSRRAARFEQYLKSGSGRAFANRHFG